MSGDRSVLRWSCLLVGLRSRKHGYLTTAPFVGIVFRVVQTESHCGTINTVFRGVDAKPWRNA